MRSNRLPLDVWLARLENFSPLEIDLGLTRVETLLTRLKPKLPTTVFHVAGTNGKGSSVALLESLLRQRGGRVGCYTSPHIIRYNERIKVNGVEASDEQIVAAFERIECVRDDVALTYFEFGTLAVMLVFEDAQIDTAILEVGMGGRLDAVNAIEPDAGLITNVSLDHCDWLGNDVETIAREKAGTMREAKPVVFASTDPPQAILEQASAVNAQLLVAERDYSWSISDQHWSWRGVNKELQGLCRPGLAGDIQIQNAAGVLTLIEAAGLQELLREDVVNRAFGSVRLNGRLQSAGRDGNWLLDVAHNPAAATVLARTLREQHVAGRTFALLGMLDDKDVAGVLTPLRDIVDTWVAVTADNSRAIPAVELARRVANACNRSCLAVASLSEAIDWLGRQVTAADRVLVTGSFYLVGPVLESLALYSPRLGES